MFHKNVNMSSDVQVYPTKVNW